jgi:hypothetical protein
MESSDFVSRICKSFGKGEHGNFTLVGHGSVTSSGCGKFRGQCVDKSVELCPFDGMPCEIVSSCDEVMFVRFGFFGFKPEWHCCRAVVKGAKR